MADRETTSTKRLKDIQGQLLLAHVRSQKPRISLGFVRRLVDEVILRRYQELVDLDELDELLKTLILTESKPFDFSELEFAELPPAADPDLIPDDEVEEVEEEEVEEEKPVNPIYLEDRPKRKVVDYYRRTRQSWFNTVSWPEVIGLSAIILLLIGAGVILS